MVELGMTSNQYNWDGSIYGIAYIIFEAPSNLLLKVSSLSLGFELKYLTIS